MVSHPYRVRECGVPLGQKSPATRHLKCHGLLLCRTLPDTLSRFTARKEKNWSISLVYNDFLDGEVIHQFHSFFEL